jgi:hypothetical protein
MSIKWYAQGIRFGCTEGGDCCHTHGEYASVYFSGREERALADHLGVTLSTVRARYVRRDRSGYRVARSKDGACIFLEGCRCSIYPVRPVPCRTWPFWPETLERGTWDREVVPFCRGVGKGKLHPLHEIEAQARAKAAHDEEIDGE